MQVFVASFDGTFAAVYKDIPAVLGKYGHKMTEDEVLYLENTGYTNFMDCGFLVEVDSVTVKE